MKFERFTAEYLPPGGSAQQNIPHVLVVPSAGTIIQLHNDRFPSFELLGYTPFGLELDWEQNAAYRYYVTFDKIRVLSAGGVTAWKVGGRFALGGGLFVNSGKTTLENKVPSIVYAGAPGLPDASSSLTGSDTSPNYHLGILWQANRTLRIGAAYRSAIDLNERGDARLTIPNGPTITDQWSAPLKLPQNVSLGFAWQATPDTLIAGQADWVDWSVLKQEVITFRQGALPNITMARNWKDRTQLRLGVEYAVRKSLALPAGYSYDPSPVPDTTLDPQLFDLNRQIVSVGFGTSSRDWTLDVAYEHFFGQSRTTTTSIHAFPTNGTYRGSADILTLTVSYR